MKKYTIVLDNAVLYFSMTDVSAASNLSWTSYYITLVMLVFEFVSSLLSELVCLLLCCQLKSVDNEQEIYTVVFEYLDFLINVTNNRELELSLIIDGGEIGLVKHAHGVNTHSLSLQLTHVTGFENLSDVRVQAFYPH
jgi:hypothetical protein